MSEHSEQTPTQERARPEIEYIKPQRADLMPSRNVYSTVQPSEMPHSQIEVPHIPAAKGLAQLFGLHVTTAVLAIIVDLMVFGGDAIGAGLLIPLGIGVACVLGFITYKIQAHWYGDDHNSALIKALIVGLLTAIPVPLTPIVAVPAGLLGVVKMVRRR